MSETFKDTFSRPPALIYRQPPSLKSLLVKAKISKNFDVLSKGCFKTHVNRCVTSAAIKETNLVQSFYTGQNFKLFHNFTCDTVLIVWIVKNRRGAED